MSKAEERALLRLQVRRLTKLSAEYQEEIRRLNKQVKDQQARLDQIGGIAWAR